MTTLQAIFALAPDGAAASLVILSVTVLILMLLICRAVLGNNDHEHRRLVKIIKAFGDLFSRRRK